MGPGAVAISSAFPILADGYSTPVPISTTSSCLHPILRQKSTWATISTMNQVPVSLLPDCQNDIVDSVNGGALFTSYIGHAQTGNWATEPLVDAGIVNRFNNYDRLSIFLAMACFEGFFHQPDLSPLAETYMLHPLGGVVASWSPTDLVLPPATIWSRASSSPISRMGRRFWARPQTQGNTICTTRLRRANMMI